MSENTTISISKETWRALHQRKANPSDTFDDVVQRLIAQAHKEE